MKIWLVIIILFFSNILHAPDYPINQYIKDLATDDQEQSFRLNNAYTEFRKYDSNTQIKLMGIIENRVKQENSEFLQVKFSFFKLFIMRFFVDGRRHQALIANFRQKVTMAKELKMKCYWQMATIGMPYL